MDKNILIESIIFKFFSGTVNEIGYEQLLEWLKECKENRIHYFTLKRIWLENINISNKEKIIDDSWERLKLRTTLQTLKEGKNENALLLNINKLLVAATILVLLGISSFFGIKLKKSSEFDKAIFEISVPLGSRTNVTLPDGTNVWLNAGSSLTYRSNFGQRDRYVSLIGEAYIDVKPDGNSVFIVNTRDLDIRVLGTQFNLKSYPDEKVTETTLISGKIEIYMVIDNWL